MGTFESVYNTMLGVFADPKMELPWVENAFQDGSECSMLYDKMLNAYHLVCERLGSEPDDRDADTILCCFESMQRELCQRMFECGIRFVFEKHYLD